MEKDTQRNNLKDHCLCTRSYIKTINNHTCSSNDNICSNHQQIMLRSPWNYSTQQAYRKCSSGGISWPPRSYTCSFCKREFRSAQALGGHMNVHRRDRARLSHSSPISDGTHFLKLSPSTNTNTKYTFPSFLSASHSSFPHPLSSISSALPPSSPIAIDKSPMQVHNLRSATNSEVGLDLSKSIMANSIHTDEELVYCKRDGDPVLRSESDIVRLDMKMGMLSDFKEELDLELRLGCS